MAVEHWDRKSENTSSNSTTNKLCNCAHFTTTIRFPLSLQESVNIESGSGCHHTQGATGRTVARQNCGGALTCWYPAARSWEASLCLSSHHCYSQAWQAFLNTITRECLIKSHSELNYTTHNKERCKTEKQEILKST